MAEIRKSNQVMDLMNDFVVDNAFLVSRELGVDLETAKDYVREILREDSANGRIVNPRVSYYGKNQYGDRELKNVTLTKYLDGAKKGILVPSGTVYARHDVELSVHTANTEERVRKRAISKKAAAVAKLEGNNRLAAMKDTEQKAYKTGNNSITGLFDNMFNPFYCPSSHYTLTSVTASVTSIGNSISESMVAGNRLYTKPDVVISHIASLATNTDLEKVKAVVDRYNLYIPTVDDCMFVILKSTRFYWSSKERDEEIRNTISLLNDLERVAFVYTNDLFHLRYFNDKLVKIFIKKLLEVKTEPCNPSEIMKDIPEDLEIMTKCIIYDDMLEHSIKKERITYGSEDNLDTQYKIASSSKKSNDFLTYIDDLISLFFRSDNLPVNIADIKDMIRGCTVLSDTDSTCSTYQDWVKWYYGREVPSFTSDEVGVAGIILLFTYRTLSHSLKLFSNRMNIHGKYETILAMKNEFFWKTMIFTGKTKHYYADTAICEGSVYAKTQLELKGSNLIDSKLPPDLKDLSISYFERVNKIITNGERINLHQFIRDIIAIEKSVEKRISELDSDIMKEEVILDHSSYKGGMLNSVYYHLMMWNEVFGPKYGKVTEVPVICIKVKTNMNTKNRMMEGIESIKDKGVRDRWLAFLKKYPKNMLETLRLPKEIVSGGGIPEELEPLIEVKSAILELCSTFYLILETLGYYKKPDVLLMDLYPMW